MIATSISHGALMQLHKYAGQLRSLTLYRFTNDVGERMTHMMHTLGHMPHLYDLTLDWTLGAYGRRDMFDSERDTIWSPLQSLTQLRTLTLLGPFPNNQSLHTFIRHLSTHHHLSRVNDTPANIWCDTHATIE